MRSLKTTSYPNEKNADYNNPIIGRQRYLHKTYYAMKRNLLYFVMAALTFIFTACPEEESEPPTACFSMSETIALVNENINFSNCSENAELYSWNFDDGNISNDYSPSHVFTQEGTYDVTLIAYNRSLTNQLVKTITIVDSQVSACFNVTSTTLQVGQTIAFFNCSDNADSYQWEFGDGYTSTAASPTHIYNTAGNYLVKLTATKNGVSDSYQQTLTINPTSNSTVSIEFIVDMNIEYLWGRFDMDNDYVEVAGSFNSWGDGTLYPLTYTGVDAIYSTTINGFYENDVIEFRFRINGTWYTSEFADGSNRSYTVKASDNLVNVWYNDVSIVTVDPYDYYGTPPNSFSDYIIDDFDNVNTSNFDEYYLENTYSTVISGGVYTINNMSESTWAFSSNIEGIDASLNYEYEVAMRITNYSEDYGCGLFWGKSADVFYLYYVNTFPYGGQAYGRHDDTGWVRWTDWSTGALTSPYWNKITVRKMSSVYYIYINEIYYHEQTTEPYFGNEYGMHVSPLATIEVDYCTVKQINLDFGTKSLLPPTRKSSKTMKPFETINPPTK